MVFSYWYYSDFGGQRATIGITGGSEKIPLSIIKSCGMEIPPSGTLDMNGSLHLIINYLLRCERREFGL